MTAATRRRPAAPPPSPTLPPLYATWIADALGSLPAREQTATCDDCAMLPDAAGSAPGLYFDRRSKCCTYIPELPNFLVGRILLDTTPDAEAGRTSVLARIGAGHQVTPLGLGQPPAFLTFYASNGAELFGRAVDLRCPHYVEASGGCSVWQHRMSTCATWFCKYDRGEAGRRVWDGVRQMLRVVERALAVHCVRTLAPGSTALREALPAPPLRSPRVEASDLGAPLDEAARRRTWGAYVGREQAFFEACGELAGSLTWADLRALGGVELDLATDVAREGVAALAAAVLPDHLALGPVSVSGASAEAVTCTAYNVFDPLQVPRALFDVLHVFDGRPTRAALAAANQLGVSLDRRVVRRLVDHGVLVDAAQAPASPV